MNTTTLIPCICGDTDPFIYADIEDVNLRIVYCGSCTMATTTYNSEEEAAIAWNTMQTALQADWTKEVPTESGIYLYLAENGSVSPREVSKDFTVYYGNLEFSKDFNFTGLWYRVAYPQSHKE